MATITIIDPDSGVTKKQISLNMEAAMVIQNLLGEIEFFLTLSTPAKDVLGSTIPKETITGLTDGAGGVGLDRIGASLPNGKYTNLTAAINDYVAMMVEGKKDEPWTEMAFS